MHHHWAHERVWHVRMQKTKNLIMFLWCISWCKVFKKSIFAFKWAAPWIKGSGNCVGTLNIRSGTLKKHRLGTKSLSTTNPPTTTLVSVVAAPTHIPCISHHPTHPLPTKSLRCQVSTAPRAIAPPLNTRACMTCAHAKLQEYSSFFFGTCLYVKSSKPETKGRTMA